MTNAILVIHLVSVILGFIVLILSIFIVLRFKLTALIFFIVLQIMLIFNLSAVLVYREGMKFGWILDEEQIYALKRMIYLFLACSIALVYLFLQFLIYRKIQLWKWIVNGILLTIYSIVIFCPCFEIPLTRTPLWGYYAYNILLTGHFIWTYLQILWRRKQVGDTNFVRIANIFLVVSPAGMLYYYFLEITGRFMLAPPVPMGYTLPLPILFILMNIAVILYGFSRFTVRSIDSYAAPYKLSGMEKKYHLSDREIEVIQYLCEGLSNRETGGRLFISELTVKTHVRNIYHKLGIKNRLELLDKVTRLNE